MITILHMTEVVPAEERFAMRFPAPGEKQAVALARVVIPLLAEPGRYEAVAHFEGGAEALEKAWVATQNGVLSDSWSRQEPEGLRVIGPPTVEHEGTHYGKRSSDIGDVFVVDGSSFHVVADLGFEKIGRDLDCAAMARQRDPV